MRYIKALWDLREVPIAAGAFGGLFEPLDKAIKDAGSIPIGDQIIDATRQRNT